MGVRSFGMTHPKIGRSKFSITEDASFTVDAQNSYASIGPESIVHVEGDFTIGKRTYINSNGRILCEDRISIGDRCAIAWNVDIIDSDRHTITSHEGSSTAPIVIGDHCWIGSNVSIKKGVTIGEGAVVASDTVVVDDVPASALVAGTPAEVKKRKVNWKK
jgi:acetyltransferase-like isoleucine patch superfamily enzyme